MCEIVEYASMRFRLVWAMATILPSASDNTDMITSMPCQSPTAPPMESARMRMMNPKAAIFGAEPMNSVIAVGAPW